MRACLGVTLVIISGLGIVGAQSAARFATSPDGTRIAFEVTGTGPALMLLHGGGQTRRAWDDAGYVAALARDFTVITVDLRGSGDSSRPERADAYAIDRLVADLISVADAAGAARFHLWGFSYGANIGRYLASRSDRVLSMVYIGIPFGAAAQGAFRDGIVQHPIGWLTAMLDYPPVEPRDMKCPTLWLVGTANAGAFESAQTYAAQLPGTLVELQWLDGLTHSQELSRRDTTLPRAVEFTTRVASLGRGR